VTDGDASEGALEERLDAQAATLTEITNRDRPLLNGTIRVLGGEEIETVDDVPAAGRSLRAELDMLADRVGTPDWVAALGDVGTAPSPHRVQALRAF